MAMPFLSHGQQYEKCYTHRAIEYQESLTPGYKAQVNSVFENAKQWAANNLEKSTGVHTIPVVVHIVYNTPQQNLHDSVIYNQIDILSKDFSRQNADTSNLRDVFNPIAGNPEIQFMLAQVDPFGQPTTGITRTYTNIERFGHTSVVLGTMDSLERVKSTANGGIDPWDQSRYLNIWVCDMSVDVFGQIITALLGYATPPDGLPNWPPGSTNGMSDGVVIQYQCFGSNNPNPLDPGTGPIDVLGRTTIHEVGHYLGLRHIWGDGDCTAQDGIDDTPNATGQSNQDCDTTKNTCTDNILGMDLPDMVENFMDYSAETCQNSFTQGQADLIKGVLENERYDLVHDNPAIINEIDPISWNIYPNPTSDKIKISTSSIISKIELLDLSGNVISSSGFTNNVIDLSDLSTGMYFIKIWDHEHNVSAKRIIVQ